MAKEKRHKRRDSPEVKTKVKQEKLSPARPHKTRRSPNDNRRRASRSPVRTRDDRSNGRREASSPGRRGSRSPRRRSPHRSADVKLKRERDEQRSGGEEQRRRNEQPQEKRGRAELERPHESERNGDRRRERDAAASQQAERRHHDEQRREKRRRREENQEVDFGHPEGSGDSPTDPPHADKEKPNFGLSGALTEDTNTFRGVVIKYNEPPEARVPKRRWRLYPFKNDEQLPVMYIHRQSAYLLGRQRKIADIPIDHPSCSKQHAVFQYRVTEFTRADGTTGRRVRPYIIDLASGNGTYLNNQRIEAQRYYELKEKDVLKFGFSSREYVLLHEFSDTSEVDAKEEPEEEEDEGLDE